MRRYNLLPLFLLLVLAGLILTAASAPVISSFTPTNGVAGTSVSLTGTGFTGATAVKFNGKAAASFQVLGATSITAVAPTGVTTGKISVTAGGKTGTSSLSFTVVAAPTITGFSPASGAGGTTVTISGTNFTGTTAIKFNGVAASSFQVTSATSLTAVAPAGVTSGTISVTNPAGTATSASTFSVVAPPTITGFTPPSGSAGITVTLTGTAFSGATAVKFNGAAASSFQVANATSLTAVTPPGVTSGTISVTTPGGTVSTSSVFTAIPAPVISSFLAAKSPVTSGDVTTLTGVFTGGTGAVDNGVGDVTSGVAYSISPSSTTTYTLTVTGPSGGTAKKQVAVTVVPPANLPVIAGPTKVTANQTGYSASVPTQSGCTYAWSIMGGTITAGATTSQVTFTPKSATGPSLSIARSSHSATLLSTGKVLLVGGFDSNWAPLASAELFDPATKTISKLTNSLVQARGHHTATLLPSGKVLIAGGVDDTWTSLSSAELFDPVSGTFATTAGSMSVARSYHTATLLADGRVLIAGGRDGQWQSTATSELYDPSTNSFSILSSQMGEARNSHTATLLQDGQVLLTGGWDPSSKALSTTDIFDPMTATFSVGPSLATPSVDHSATLLGNGQVLLAGGIDSSGGSTSNASIYEPTTKSIIALPAHMNAVRSSHAAVLMTNGKVLLGGGLGNGEYLNSVEIYDPSTSAFTGISEVMSSTREGHTATLLQNGQVLLSAGDDFDSNGNSRALATTDLFTSSANSFHAASLGCVVTNAAGTPSAPGLLTFIVWPSPSTPVISAPPGYIGGHTSYVASVTAQADCTYSWTITNGTITAGQNAAEVTFDAGTGATLSLTCVVTNPAGTSKSSTANLTLQPSILTLTPTSANIAPGGQQVLTANQPVTWTLLDAGSLSYTSTQGTFKATYGGTNLGIGTYRVLATSRADANLTAMAAISVVTADSPVINAFTANPGTVHAGQSATLTWDVANATYLLVDALGPVTGSSGNVSPAQKTTYCLWASNDFGSVRAWVTVDVDQIPAITSFTTDPNQIPLGSSSQLTGTFSNGTGQVDRGVGAVGSGVPVSVTPSGSGNYTLTVTNLYGATTKSSAYVNVLGPGSYSALPPMQSYKTAGIATQLRDGRVAIFGGIGTDSQSTTLFDPEQAIYQNGPTVTPRVRHTATVCANGNVLLWGGIVPSTSSNSYNYHVTYEVYNPSLGTVTWSSTTGDLAQGAYPNSISGRFSHTATLLADGRVLIVGGQSLRDGLTYSAWEGDQSTVGTALLVTMESLDRNYSTFAVTGALATSRKNHAAIRLMDGRVLVAGGTNRVGTAGSSYYQELPLTSAEVYDPATGTWSAAGNLNDPSHAKNPVLLPDGRVLFDGREVFDPATLTFVLLPIPNPDFSGFGNSCVPLTDGRVLMNRVPSEVTAPLYDIDSNNCFGVANPPVASGSNFQHLIPLPDGTVLGAGWYNSSASGLDSFRFDPQSRLSITPASGHTNVGAPLVLTAAGSEAQGLTWVSSGGSVDQSGRFQAQTPGIYSVTATAPSGRKASAMVDVHPTVGVVIGSVSLPNGILNAGVPVRFPVRVINTPDQRVTWSVQEGPSTGVITPEGLFLGTSAGTCHVVATSVVDPTQSATKTLTVFPPISLSITPLTPSVAVGDSVTFQAQEPSGQNVVTWSVNGINVTTGSGFTYTAPMTPGTYTIKAVSWWDPTVSATTTLTVVPIDAFYLTPADTSVVAFQQASFKAFTTSVLGTKDVTSLVTWSSPGGTFSTYYPGQFTASGSVGTYLVQALLGDSLAATGTLKVIPIDSIYLNPSKIVIATGEQFYPEAYIKSANGTQAYPQNIEYTCSGGSLSMGAYTAPSTPGTYFITVKVIGTSTSATTKVMVVPPEFFKTNEGGTQIPRAGYSVTRLLDGRVLIAGGGNTSAELYDPVTKVFQNVTAPMTQSRQYHSATLLPDGKVLLVGGEMQGAHRMPAELFDPATQTFSPILSLPNFRHIYHLSTLLPDGRVLLAGGLDEYALKSMEVYDPLTGLFTSIGSLNNANTSFAGGAISLLADGRVLFAGEDTRSSENSPSEMYDFRAGVTTTLGRLNAQLTGCTFIRYQDDRVGVFGGLSGDSPAPNEWFDPATNTFQVGPLLSVSSSTADAAEQVDGSIYLGRNSKRFYPDSGICDIARSIGNAFAASGTSVLLPTGELLRVGYSSYSQSTTRGAVLTLSDTSPGLVVLPRRITLLAGRSWPFQASATGLGSAGFTWSVTEGSSGGTVSAQGVYTAPFSAGTYHVAAISNADGSVQATAVVDVLSQADVLVSPSLIQVGTGAQFQFTSSVVGVADASVTWSTTDGTITSGGLFTAPATATTLTVTATSVADPTRSSSATVVVSSSGGGTGIPAPILKSFTTDTNAVLLGQPAALSWNVVGAYKLVLYYGYVAQDVTGLTSIQVRPTATTNYWLSAVNPSGTVNSLNITITVSTTPVSLSITPKTLSLFASGQEQFGFNLIAPTNRLIWSAVGGSVTSTGLYTAPTTPGTYLVTVTSVDDASKSDTATVSVQDIQLGLQPSSITLDPGQSIQFGATYLGPPSGNNVWSATGGTISQTGLYTAPAALGSYTVSLYNTAEPSLIRRASVTVATPTIQVTPSTATVIPSGTIRFSAVVRSGGVVWSVVEANGGTITQDGLYTAPPIMGTYNIKVVSSIDQNQSALAKVVVSPTRGGGGGGSPVTGNPGTTGAQVTITPGTAEVDAGTYFPFSATVAGADDQSVTWQVVGGSQDAVIDASGTFTASRSGNYQVTATSVADPTAIATAGIFVTSALHPDRDNPLLSLRGYSVTALDDGRVLIAGGQSVPVNMDPSTVTYSASAWLYDPATKAYTPTGNLLTARCDHHAVKLANGRVLIAGGYARWSDPWQGGMGTSWKGQPFGHDYPFAEIYDPSTGTFTALPSQAHAKPSLGSYVDQYYPGVLEGPGMMGTNHAIGARSLLLSDGRVWFAGGTNGWANHLPLLNWTAEGVEYFDPTSNIFRDPTSTSPWGLSSGPWAQPIVHDAVERLNDGRVFVSGGLVINAPIAANATRSKSAVWNPSTDQAVPSGDMKVSRMGHTATRLADGRILLVAGATGVGTYNNAGEDRYGYYDFSDTDTAEIYDPATDTCTLVPGKLNQTRRDQAALLLPTGQVIIVGGRHWDGAKYVYPNEVELFDPNAGTFSVMDHLDYGLSEPQLALMGDGNVFVAGQVQAPMEPPAAQSAMKANKLLAADVVSNILSAGSGMLGTINVQPWIAIYGGLPVNYTYSISAESNNGSPQMPDIPAVLSYLYQDGDLVEWLAEITYTMPRNGTSNVGGDITLTTSFPWTAGVGRKFPLGLQAFLLNGDQVICGGRLKLTARYTRAGKTVVSSPRDVVNIIGQNPQLSSVDTALTCGSKSLSTGVTLSGSDLTMWLKAIACQETNGYYSQFSTVNNGRYAVQGYPYLNLGGDGGMGIMQITNNFGLDVPTRTDLLWAWDSNVDAGVSVFNGTINTAASYPGQIAKQSLFLQAVQQTNAARVASNLPPVRVNIPPFDSEQVIEDAVRGYNGFAHKTTLYPWQFGITLLHEYHLQMDSGGSVLILTNEQDDPQNPGGRVADAVWVRVLTTERPSSGDPSYVDHVRGWLGAN